MANTERQHLDHQDSLVTLAWIFAQSLVTIETAIYLATNHSLDVFLAGLGGALAAQALAVFCSTEQPLSGSSQDAFRRAAAIGTCMLLISASQSLIGSEMRTKTDDLQASAPLIVAGLGLVFHYLRILAEKSGEK